MKTIDRLMAEFYEAFKGARMPPVDGTIRGMLYDAWQSGKEEASEASRAEVAELRAENERLRKELAVRQRLMSDHEAYNQATPEAP